MPEVALEMGVIFSVGIPLANSGLGIFGFLGRFVVNGARTLPPGPDPIQQEIDWYHAPLDQKYAPRQGAWALGLGAVVGTLPGTPADPYLRIGADDVNGRTGPPVTLTVLPSTLNVQAWSYLMIEAHQLHALGGDTSLNFDGFSVGFGAGFELKYGTDSIGLD